MKTIQLDEAQSRLAELVDSVVSGEDVLITRDDKPVARLTAPAPLPDARTCSPSLRDLRPASVGAVLRPLSPSDDLLDEMLGE